MQDLSHTHIRGSFHAALTKCPWERSDVMGEVKAQHSDSGTDSQRRAVLVSSSLVVMLSFYFK